jgi:hypothetical protein
MDRMSGAGAWARDPDAVMIMTPHEEEDCYTVSSIVRSLPPKKDFVVQWDYPLMSVTDLDPSELRSVSTKKKIWTDREFIETCVPVVPARLKDIKLLTEKMAGIPVPLKGT